jgi:hypothetical protein
VSALAGRKPGSGALAAVFALASLGAQCTASEAPQPAAIARSGPAAPSARPSALEAWSVVYGVLQHPRCLNCHPAGDVPLQGDDSLPHAQNVQRGPDGRGLWALRCDACHGAQNAPGPHLPPGAPNWHLPRPEMPLVFEGRDPGELCRQLLDPAQNGGRSPEQLLEHMAHDALVLWGWSPGEGRAPVSTPHAELVAALRRWIDGGCACPD